MATKNITDLDGYTITIDADINGPRSGVLTLRANNGSFETVTIGPTGSEIVFTSLGTAGQRSGFLAVIEAARAAARAVKGYS